MMIVRPVCVMEWTQQTVLSHTWLWAVKQRKSGYTSPPLLKNCSPLKAQPHYVQPVL